jgi:tetratricopeptide (TPR) repeat protein
MKLVPVWTTPLAFAFILCYGVAMSVTGFPQEPKFRNPAMEEQDEFQKAFTKGRVLASEGDFEEAISEFKRAAKLRNDQSPECFQFIAQSYFALGRYKDAAAAYRQAIGLKPENEAELNNGLGVTLYLQDDKKVLPEAVAAFNQAIEKGGGKLIKVYYNLGYALMKLGRVEEGRAALAKYLEIDPRTPNAGEVRAIIANPKLASEKFAPGFRVSSNSGEELSLDKYRGRVVLIDFWATWCGPCRVELPEVKGIWKKYGGDKFVIIGVSLDKNPRAFENYVKAQEITWPQYLDVNGNIARLYNVQGIPHTVLIDQEGIIRGVGYRGGSLARKVGDMVKKLEER